MVYQRGIIFLSKYNPKFPKIDIAYYEGVEKQVSREEKPHFATIYGGFR
jgi:hypothetical protein